MNMVKSAKKSGKGITGGTVTLTPVKDASTEGMDDLNLIYKELLIQEYSSKSEHGPLTPQIAKDLMGWETEIEYKKRMIVEEPGTSPDDHAYGDEFHCIDTKGQKVRCPRNAGNRYFHNDWCESLTENILRGDWAGPLTVPDGTVNGETVRVSKYGRMLSGQHQLTALIRAAEVLQNERNSKKYNPAKPEFPFWNGHDFPVIETIVIKGLSEDERILRTIDYVQQRTVADMLYTMDTFKNKSSVERKEMTRMLANALDFLWTRTDAKGYRTHPEMAGFLERHKKLFKCVEHLFNENSSKKANGGRKISKLGVNAGDAAALMYIMASNPADPSTRDKYSYSYRNANPPVERKLKWDHWERAEAFWTRLADGKSFQIVRDALDALANSSVHDESNTGMGGRSDEKLALLSNAWEVWKEYKLNEDGSDGNPVFNDEDREPGGILYLSYSTIGAPKISKSGELIPGKDLPVGKIRLIDTNDFGGIDHVGSQSKVDKTSPPDPDMTPEEIEAATEEERKRKLAEFNEKTKSNKSKNKRKKKEEETDAVGVSEEGNDEAE